MENEKPYYIETSRAEEWNDPNAEWRPYPRRFSSYQSAERAANRIECRSAGECTVRIMRDGKEVRS